MVITWSELLIRPRTKDKKMKIVLCHLKMHKEWLSQSQFPVSVAKGDVRRRSQFPVHVAKVDVRRLKKIWGDSSVRVHSWRSFYWCRPETRQPGTDVWQWAAKFLGIRQQKKKTRLPRCKAMPHTTRNTRNKALKPYGIELMQHLVPSEHSKNWQKSRFNWWNTMTSTLIAGLFLLSLDEQTNRLPKYHKAFDSTR